MADNESIAAAEPSAPPPRPTTEFSILNTEFRVITKVISRRTLIDTLGERHLKPFVFITKNLEENFSKALMLVGRLNNFSTTRELKNATIFRLTTLPKHANLVSEIRGFSSDWLVALLDEEILAKGPKARAFILEQTVGHSLIQFAVTAPKNPTLRAHFAAIFGEPMPDDVDTFEKIKDWAEYGFEAPLLDGPLAMYRNSDGDFRRPLLSRTTIVRVDPVVISASIVRRGTEFGSCMYSVNLRDEVDSEITMSRLTEITSQAVTFQQMVREVTEELFNQVQEADYCGEYRDYEYTDYNSDEGPNLRSEVSNNGLLTENLTTFLRNTYGETQAQEILSR